MKRRLNLAVSLVHEPKMVLLDEPTVGVDPHSRENIFTIVRHGCGLPGPRFLHHGPIRKRRNGCVIAWRSWTRARSSPWPLLNQLLSEAGCSEVIEVRGLPAVDLGRLFRPLPGVRIERLEDGCGSLQTARYECWDRCISRWGATPTRCRWRSRRSASNLFLQLTGKELRD